MFAALARLISRHRRIKIHCYILAGINQWKITNIVIREPEISLGNSSRRGNIFTEMISRSGTAPLPKTKLAASLFPPEVCRTARFSFSSVNWIRVTISKPRVPAQIVFRRRELITGMFEQALVCTNVFCALGRDWFAAGVSGFANWIDAVARSSSGSVVHMKLIIALKRVPRNSGNYYYSDQRFPFWSEQRGASSFINLIVVNWKMTNKLIVHSLEIEYRTYRSVWIAN